ncbi:MAG: hypothetical protein NTY48_02060 [Candidatus Diapherotrites archaeon]|nr:hypothetical protein [Candidatus Diapherotrites archaeon]
MKGSNRPGINRSRVKRTPLRSAFQIVSSSKVRKKQGVVFGSSTLERNPFLLTAVPSGVSKRSLKVVADIVEKNRVAAAQPFANLAFNNIEAALGKELAVTKLLGIVKKPLVVRHPNWKMHRVRFEIDKKTKQLKIILLGRTRKIEITDPAQRLLYVNKLLEKFEPD